MKTDPLFEKCLKTVSPAVRAEVRLNMDIINRIHDILEEKHMTQRELAAKMGKRESEISRWLSGERGFTTSTIAKISAALGEPIVEVPISRYQDAETDKPSISLVEQVTSRSHRRKRGGDVSQLLNRK